MFPTIKTFATMALIYATCEAETSQVFENMFLANPDDLDSEVSILVSLEENHCMFQE